MQEPSRLISTTCASRSCGFVPVISRVLPRCAFAKQHVGGEWLCTYLACGSIAACLTIVQYGAQRPGPGDRSGRWAQAAGWAGLSEAEPVFPAEMDERVLRNQRAARQRSTR